MAFREDFEQIHHDTLRNFIYTPLSEAIKIQESRQQQALKVEGLTIPKPLLMKRTAVICRQIATPNYEMQRVIKLAEQHDLNLVIFTYEQDKFSSSNYYKHSLGKMGFFKGTNKRGETIVNFKTIVNFNHCNGKTLNECKTFRGESLQNFHQNLLRIEFPQIRPQQFFRIETWLDQNHLSTTNYYPAFLQLFLSHAILFETFVLTNNERDFTFNTFLPAFEAIYKEYGIKPLIVSSDAPELEGDPYWQLYPGHLQAYAPYERRKKPRSEP